MLKRTQSDGLFWKKETWVEPPDIKRKPVVILSAEVQGYRRLLSDDKEATVATLTAYRNVLTALIRQRRGRVVDAPGNNLLTEFASAVDALRGAVAIQQELRVRNGMLPTHRQMLFRIGLNLDDGIVQREHIYGDGVNIATCVEELIDGDGIFISGSVYEQVSTRVTLSYEDLGEQRVKNMAKPVRVYRVSAPLRPAETPSVSATLLASVPRSSPSSALGIDRERLSSSQPGIRNPGPETFWLVGTRNRNYFTPGGPRRSTGCGKWSF